MFLHTFHLEYDIFLSQIKEHFEQFDKYDANDDHTLDFVEMLQAIRGTVGDYFKPRQIKVTLLHSQY